MLVNCGVSGVAGGILRTNNFALAAAHDCKWKRREGIDQESSWISTAFLLKTLVKALVNESLEFSVNFHYQQGKKITPQHPGYILKEGYVKYVHTTIRSN